MVGQLQFVQVDRASERDASLVLTGRTFEVVVVEGVMSGHLEVQVRVADACGSPHSGIVLVRPAYPGNNELVL